MELIKQTELSNSQKNEIFELWNDEYPEKLSYKSILTFDKYLKNLNEQSHILLVDRGKKIKGWYFDFVRDGENWFAILLNSKVKGKGLGTEILNIAKQKKTELNGWVIDHNRDKKKNGEFYKTPIDFYIKNGFEKISNCRLELEKISAVKIKWRK